MTFYEDELNGLQSTFSAARKRPLDADLAQARDVLRGRAMIAIASGGAMPAAMLASRWHTEVSLQNAQHMSPQEFLGLTTVALDTVLVVISAQARHPDTRKLVSSAIERDLDVILVTQRTVLELEPTLRAPRVHVLTVPMVGERDGFLATNSLLSSVVVLARLYQIAGLPSRLRRPSVLKFRVREQLLVLFDSATMAIGRDIETRFSELGLSAVQAVDYRTFAHGRHLGVDRNSARTTVIGLLTPLSTTGRATLKLLPNTLDIHVLEIADDSVAGIIELLVAAMYLPIYSAAKDGVTIHKPGVAAFGRQLYHLSPRSPRQTLTPAVRRKMEALRTPEPDALQFFSDAYSSWRHKLLKVGIGAIALDYDGTVVSTVDRYSLPQKSVRVALTEALDNGIALGFASGRGDSLHRDLRKWIPKRHWKQVLLGMHNGAWICALSADPIDSDVPGDLLAAQERIQERLSPSTITTRLSGSQLSVQAQSEWVSSPALLSLIECALESAPKIEVVAGRSGHSVDVVLPGAGKSVVVDILTERYGGVVAIGDQGDVGGNDFEMLSSTTFSISVDRCSADPTRCWAIGPKGTVGPSALVEIVSAVEDRRGIYRLDAGKVR